MPKASAHGGEVRPQSGRALSPKAPAAGRLGDVLAASLTGTVHVKIHVPTHALGGVPRQRHVGGGVEVDGRRIRVSTRTGADSMKTTIFSTEDNGLTWKVISPGANQDPGNELPEAGNKTGFSFINSQRGWLGVADQPKALVLYRTDNGGRNWNLQTIPVPQNLSSLVATTLPPVFFEGNTNDGLLPVIFSAQPGADGSLVFYTTSDGGVGWLPAGSLEGGKVFSFIDPLTGWAWAKRALYFTTDGTKTWQILPVAFGATEQAISIKFINKNNGWILTRDLKNRVRIYSTNDGGNTWVAFAP